MSNEIAGLLISVDSSSVETANKRTDTLATNVVKLERATDALNGSNRQRTSATAQLTEQMRRLDDQERAAYAHAIQLARATRDVAAAQDAAAVSTGRAATSMAGLAARAVGSIIGFTAMGAAMGLLSAAGGWLADKFTEAARKNEELAEKVAKLRAEVDKTVPSLNGHGRAMVDGAEALKNFDSWVVTNTLSLKEQADAAKMAAVNVLMLQHAQATTAAAELRRNQVPSGGGVGMAGSLFRLGQSMGLIGATPQNRAALAEADNLVIDTERKLTAALDASSEAFVRHEKAAKKTTDAVSEFVKGVEEFFKIQRQGGEAAALGLLREGMGRPNIDPVASMAKYYADDEKKRDAKAREQEIAILREQEGLAKSYTERLRISRQVEAAERAHELATEGFTAKLLKTKAELDREDLQAAYSDFTDALGGAADALQDGNWGVAIMRVLSALKTLEWASLSSAGKIGAAAGIANIVGGAIGGTAGNAISGAAAGAMAGLSFGPAGAAIGAAVGLIGSLIGSSKQKKAEEQQRAAAAAQEAANKALAIANERRALEIALMEASGDSVGALAARRADELAATDASNRADLERLYALQDQAAATAKAAAAAEEAARAAAALAEKAADLARQQRGLEIQVMEAQGRSLEALAMRREDELAAMDASLRLMQQYVWFANDIASARATLAAANDNVSAAELALANLRQQESNRAAQAVVDSLKAVSDAADKTLQEVSGAAQEAAQRVEQARATLSAAYEREAGALQTTIDKFKGFADGLRAFREGLGNDGAGGMSYAAARAAFRSTAALAAAGDAGGLGSLQGASESFLNASKARAGSAIAFQRDLAAVRAALLAGEGAAGGQVSTAQAQLDALNQSVDGLLQINQSVVSVRDAISGLSIAQAGQAQAQLAVDVAQSAAMNAMAQAQAAQASFQASQAAQQAQSQAAAVAAAQQAVVTAQQQQAQAKQVVDQVNNTKPAGYTNWDSYLTHYADVAAAYFTDPNGQASGRTRLEWAKLHWDVSGKDEGRTPYRLGGAFLPGGQVVSGATAFNNSQMAEDGPEAIMPLAWGPGGLGVRIHGANDDAAGEIRALRADVARLERALQAIAVNTSKTARETEKNGDLMEQLSDGGVALRVTEAA